MIESAPLSRQTFDPREPNLQMPVNDLNFDVPNLIF